MIIVKKSKALSFFKYEATGNDFVLLDAIKQPLPAPSETRTEIMRPPLRHRLDGLLVVQQAIKGKSSGVTYRMRMYNPDGSEDMCGNGLRCVAAYLYHAGYVKDSHFSIQTLSGLRQVSLNLKASRELKSISVNLGRPKLDAKAIPVAADIEQVLDYPLKIAGRTIKITALSTGTPHAIVFTADPSKINSLGQAIMQHPFFPEQTSVSFVKTVGRQLFARVWERGGVGESLSCGTGAAAILAAASLKGLVPREAEIIFPGGKLHVRWDDNDDLWLTGPAHEVFRGLIESVQSVKSAVTHYGEIE